MNDAYCSMIHGGLQLTFKNSTPLAGHCCLRGELFLVDDTTDFWNHSKFEPLRKINLAGKWDTKCNNCQRLENAGEISMRQGMNDGLKISGQTQLAGPARIDLMFDISCNLACRTCGPQSSTFWIKQLGRPVTPPRSGQDVISALSKLDLTNLRQLVFCGGETLLGQSYWEIADWLANNVPNAKQQLTVCFQTNGTQPILEKNYKIIEKLRLVKMHISMDGTHKQFEYLRWPASWQDTTDNILKIRANVPGNVMFVIEETVSIFNALYHDDVKKWVQENFSSNKEGDIVNHTKHVAGGLYSLEHLSQEYVDELSKLHYASLIPTSWRENPENIKKMISEINHYDRQRNQNFALAFPKIADCYRRFI